MTKIEYEGAYVGRCPGCNEVVAATLILRGRPEWVAGQVAEMIASGLLVDRVAFEEAAKGLSVCRCQP